MLAVALLVGSLVLLAVITALPSASAVTNPAAFTVAMVGALELQVTA